VLLGVGAEELEQPRREAFLAEVGGKDLTGEATSLQPGTFWPLQP